MKNIIVLLSFLFFNLATMMAQSDKELLALDNYLIPKGKKGAVVGSIPSLHEDKFVLAKDTSGLFMISKLGQIQLKKGKMLTEASSYRYEIVIATKTGNKVFELVKS